MTDFVVGGAAIERVVKVQRPVVELGVPGPELYMVYDEHRAFDFVCEPTPVLRALFKPGVYKVYALARIDIEGQTFEVQRLVEDQQW